MLLNRQKFHFIAAGGVGMSALAEYLVQKGAVVTGSDIEESKYTHQLEKLGVKITIGHNANLIKPDMLIIASSAIKSDNPEIMEAKKLNLKILHRSDVLKMISDEFVQNKNAYFIGFAGTHGKTTTSGLCSYILNKINVKPSFIVGGIIPELNTNGKYDSDSYLIAELDESDGTIQKYSTDIAVINNLELDHLDYYKNGFEDIAITFNNYLLNNPKQKVIINTDNVGNNKFISMYPNYNFITFGLKNADYTVKNIKYINLGSEFDIYYKNSKLDTIKLSIPGEHNIYNALAVYCVLKEAQIPTENVKEYFYTFKGMGRRFQKVCEIESKKIKIYDDYAHHPSEIKTTLSGIKQTLKSDDTLTVIFQPHRYTRLQGLWEEFKTAFKDADKLIITDVYPAGETPIENINSQRFAKEVIHQNSIYISGNMQECARKITKLIKENEIVITLGAGTITKLGKLIEQEFKKAN